MIYSQTYNSIQRKFDFIARTAEQNKANVKYNKRKNENHTWCDGIYLIFLPYYVSGVVVASVLSRHFHALPLF